MRKVIVLGAGGHAKMVIEALRSAGDFDLVGLLDADAEQMGQTVLGSPILGSDDLMESLATQGIRHFVVGLGSVGNSSARQRLFERAVAQGLEPATLIHSRAVVSSSARIGRGTCILAGAIVSAHASLGDNVIVNTGAIIEHDCGLDHHVHIATGACLAGEVKVGQASHVGISACVREGLRIGQNSIVGAGAVVVKDVPDAVVVCGVPARFLKSNPR